MASVYLSAAAANLPRAKQRLPSSFILSASARTDDEDDDDDDEAAAVEDAAAAEAMTVVQKCL